MVATLIGRVLDLRFWGCWFKPHRRNFVLLLRTVGSTHPNMTEKVLTGTCKGSNLTNKLNNEKIIVKLEVETKKMDRKGRGGNDQHALD